MTTVRHILEDKGHQIWSAGPGDTVYDAIKMMADKDVGSLVVLDDSKIVGIITERDYARNVFLKGRASPQTRVHDIMERNVVCVGPDQSIEQCMALMTTKRLRHLPVTESGALLGNNLSTVTVQPTQPKIIARCRRCSAPTARSRIPGR